MKAFSLIATVLLPYLSKKIEEKLTLYKLQAVDGHLNEKVNVKIRKNYVNSLTRKLLEFNK